MYEKPGILKKNYMYVQITLVLFHVSFYFELEIVYRLLLELSCCKNWQNKVQGKKLV